MNKYTEQLIKIIEVQRKDTLKIHYLSIAVFVVIVFVTGIFTINKLQSKRISLARNQGTLANEIQELPITGVAGASNKTVSDEGFSIIAAENNPPELGTAGVCALTKIFSLGDKESSPKDNPGDELNWVGALDVVPSFENPYVVGKTDTSYFPWRTDSDNQDTLTTELLFNYVGKTGTATLTLGWSPGSEGEKYKEVFIDNELVGQTPKYNGTFDTEHWEFMPLAEDSISFTLNPGKHTLKIKNISTSGESIWDYIDLKITSCM